MHKVCKAYLQALLDDCRQAWWLSIWACMLEISDRRFNRQFCSVSSGLSQT